MGNLGQREKYGVIAVIILIVMFGIYFFGIRKNQQDAEELSAKATDLQAQIDYYDSLKAENEQTQAEIHQIESTISDLESQFIPVIQTENLERYVINKFKSKNCMYLNTITSENAVPDRVVLPSGDLSNDALLITSISVEYSTTDGLLPGAYNMTGEAHIDRTANAAPVEDQLADIQMLPFEREYDWRGLEEQYNAFIEALKEIEVENTDCVKISSISIEGESGYLLLGATINFYSANFTNRVSEPVFNDPFEVWSGDALTSFGHDGFFGQRLLVPFNCGTNTLWAGTIMFDDDAIKGARPFTAYYAKEMFEDLVNEYGLAAVIYHEGIDDALVNAEGDVQPDEPAA